MFDANSADVRLWMVEGLPGVGKSTTARNIAEALQRKGKTVCFADEGTPQHPADDDRYNFPDFATERTAILGRWQSFVARAEQNTVYVFNCLLLQNPMSETMMRFGMTEEASSAYIQEIATLIAPLHPRIIYLSEPDIRQTMAAVLPERGQDWLYAVMDYHTKQGYGRAHGLCGYEGYLQCLAERKRRELRILATLPLPFAVVSRREAMDMVQAIEVTL